MRVVISARIAADARCLDQMLRRRFKDMCADVEVEFCAHAEPFEDALFAFFDADMPESLSYARKLRANGIKTPIAFFADSDEYALSCYGAHPAGYLVKPFAYAQLCGLLDWHRGAFAPALRSLNVVNGRMTVKIYLADIVYIEIRAHTCLIHCKSGVISTNRSLASIEAQLGGDAFLRVHRKFLVNMRHVADAVSAAFIMDNGDALPIGAQNAARIIEAYRAHKETREL